MRTKKKLWNTKVTLIPMVIYALGRLLKRLVKVLEDIEMRGQERSIQSSLDGPLISLLSWFVVLFYSVSTLFGLFNAELNFKQFSLA